MSKQQNVEWLEAADEHFEGAIEEGNYQLARDVIADVFDRGFPNESAELQRRLDETPLSKFAIKSNLLSK